jgi:hypothetical protein
MKFFAIASTFIIFSLTASAHAEVMDKELSVDQIWQMCSWSLLVCAVAAALWRWLLLPSFFLGVFSDLGFTWTEWFNAYTGPAMWVEAGSSYGYQLHAALVALILAHITGWVVSSRWSLIARWRSPVTSPMHSRGTLLFAGLMWSITALTASQAGFGATALIWLSPPMVAVTLIFIAFVAINFGRRRGEREPGMVAVSQVAVHSTAVAGSQLQGQA